MITINVLLLVFVLKLSSVCEAPPLKCYQCYGLGQDCRDEVVSKNSSFQRVCDGDDDRCIWVYQRLNSSFGLFGMGCSSARICKELPQECQEAVGSNELECCDGSCCDSDFCNKLRYTDGRFCKRRQDLVAVIYGGAEVIRGVRENILLNGSLSYDPETGENVGMNFTWYYGIIPRSNQSSIQFLQQGLFTHAKASAIQNKGISFGLTNWINSNFTSENGTLVINLTVAKDYRTSSVLQVVHLVEGNPPRVYQRCLINCNPKVIPSVKLSIESTCHGSQCSNITSYHWSLYQRDKANPTAWKQSNELQLITSTPLNSSRIVIKENSLNRGMSYRLTLLVSNTDSFAGISAYDFSTSLSPVGGTCTIEPSSGIALRTYFTLSCSGWTSSNTPLSYQFQVQLSNGPTSVVYHGFNTSVEALLPSGDSSQNFTLQIDATVCDSNGASATYENLSVQIKPFKDINSETMKRHLDALEKIDNLNKAVQVANIMLQAISSSSTLQQSEIIKAKELIVEKIATFHVKNLPDLMKISSVLGSATQDTGTVSTRTLLISLAAIDSMTSLLMSKAKAKNVNDIPLITSSAKNLGFCLNNKLKIGSLMASGTSVSIQGRQVVNRCMQLVSTVSDAILAVRLPDEEAISIQTSDLSFTLGRYTPARLKGLKVKSDNGNFALPVDSNALVFHVANNSFVDAQMLSIAFNPFTWDSTRERVNSYVISLDLKDDRQKVMEISDISSDIVIEMTPKSQNYPPQMPPFFTRNNSPRFHEIKVDYENTKVQLDIAPKDALANLVLYIKFGQRPTIREHDLNATISSYKTCIWFKMNESLEGKNGCYSNPLIEVLAKRPGMYYLAVLIDSNITRSQKRQKRSCFGQRRQRRACVDVKSPPPTPPQSENVSVVPVYDPSTDRNYTLRVTMGSCVYWSDTKQKWTTDGCRLLSATLNGSLKCSCNHLTSFGGSLLVKPNPIDFDKVLVEFKKLDDTGNVAVIVTVMVAFMVYFLVLFVARRADKRDVARTSPTRHLSTSSSNTYEYEITVTTGIWWNSGTTAKVAMEIYGAEGSTGIVQLGTEVCSEDSLFYRGSSEVFVLTVDKPLGFIHGVRVGHDNSGTSPSWFLEDIVIVDKQTQKSWTFANKEWLALERGDGRIERMLELLVNDDTFKTNVLKRWWKGLTEKHIWVSVLTKPPRDPFSRVRRASCCLSLLLSAMLANAMFYDLTGKSEQVIQVGPLKFSWRQVVIGVQSALIVAPINILVASLFQKGSLRTTNQLPRRCCVHDLIVYIAWFLCFCTCVVSATFSIFYSLVWGKSLSEQWLSSMLISFAQDVVVNEPAKVFVAAILLASILRLKRGNSEGYSILEEISTHNVQCSKERLWTMNISEVEAMRRRQAKKQNISRFYVELIVYSAFVFILMVVCYGSKNDHQYLLAKSTRDGLRGFHVVFNNSLYWNWLRAVFLHGVYAGVWYNGQVEKQSIYIGNKRSLLVGMPRLRQLRVKSKPCKVLDHMKSAFPVCYDVYSDKNEDTTPFHKPGWIPLNHSTKKDELFQLCPKPWRYEKPGQGDAIPKWGQFSMYPGGGFIADLGYDIKTALVTLKTLQRHNWLDRQSRSVILEFAAFNPSTNFIVVATYFYEIQSSSFSAPLEKINIISVYSKETGSHQFYLVCILLFIIFVLLYVGRICYRCYRLRLRFFKSFWNWMEIFQVLVSVLAVVMNIVRSAEAVSTVTKLKENVYANVSFQEVIAWTEAENGVLGILVFIVTLKLLRLIRFNTHVAVFLTTLKVSSKLLRSYMAVLAVGFMAFLHFGILIFGAGSEKYSSILKATYFQLELILGRVKARPINELSDANDTFGRIFAALLLMSLTIMFMNFFIAALNDTLSDAKTAVSHNELYTLVDESNSTNDKNRTFFEAISQLLKQRSLKGQFSPSHDQKLHKHSRKSRVSATVDLDSVRSPFHESMQNRNRESSQPEPSTKKRKSFYDGVSEAIRQVEQARCMGIVTILQINKLRTKEKELFGLLDEIVQGYSEEEDAFIEICNQIKLNHL